MVCMRKKKMFTLPRLSRTRTAITEGNRLSGSVVTRPPRKRQTRGSMSALFVCSSHTTDLKKQTNKQQTNKTKQNKNLSRGIIR